MKAPYLPLAKTRDFNLLLKLGRFYRGAVLDIKVLELAKIKAYFPKKEDPDKFVLQQRLAFSVGLKYSKKAVERSLLRRRLREAARAAFNNCAPTAGWYALIVAKPAAKGKSYAEISQELALLLQLARISK